MLVPVAATDVDALTRGVVADHPVAPGWPHDGTAPGLSYVRTGGVCFLILDDAGRVAGECGTKTPTRPDGSVEIGYGLAGPSRGRGLGARAVAELVDWVTTQDGVTCIEAEVHVSNTASRRVVERLGFIADGPPADGYLQYRRVVEVTRR